MDVGKSRRSFLDRDFVETEDGLLFCVIGNVHPPERVIAYLKYAPAQEKTKWGRKGTSFSRVLPFYSAVGVSKVRELLEERHPDFVVWDPVLGIEMIEVPRDRISFHYIPEDRLEEIMGGPRDPLEKRVVELVTTLIEESGVGQKYFGVTGSILLGIHNPAYSDIDLTIYGKENSYRLKETILHLIDHDRRFYRAYGRTLEEWSREIASIYPLSIKEAEILRGREKWDRIFFEDVQFSVHPILLEPLERYGERIYKGRGIVEIRARVSNTEYSLFTPAIYGVENVEVVSGPKGVEMDIREVVSFESLYRDIAEEEERILVRGKLEEVIDSEGERNYHRVVVGTFEAGGEDYIKPERWYKELP
ncbi:MAG: hypothetical protein QI197_04740 [Candidatus Korarchaeota archaeon]|nr:hypothetical protein [Candidatus Korarchaeota archaeon]